MVSQCFSKARRLQRRAEFQRVFDAGKRTQGRYFTLLVTTNKAGTARLGIVASRKLGDAVRRNRAKRLIREIFRRTVPTMKDGSAGLPGIDVVVIPRRELFDVSYAHLENDFQAAWRRGAGRAPASGGR
jgi:ribonuclease P protein component